MIHETMITFVGLDGKGNEKPMKERYLVVNKELFGEVEATLYKEFADLYKGFDIPAIKRSKLREIINEKPVDSDNPHIFFATLLDHFITDDGEEKTTQYIVALFAKDMPDANRRIAEYMKQGMQDLELVGVKKTKFIDVLS